MLKVFSQEYNEDKSYKIAHSYEEALELISSEIDAFASEYEIVHVDHTRNCYYGNGGARHFLDFPTGTVTVLVSVKTTQFKSK